ncbi:DUF4435 domain-containing protein [Hymenobacter lapidiphilus]|uniref:DUF4435 domain-containing protein n=1 Tax=Hymenobacter lapidiphilus TaxID=2608003 RepID=A0A7Y7U588_9BACT|nr:DUF4435 domain-containing protein [Hymenobacter lapidiphilus]NVO31486.1 DUF4435 domain-containing protein [Hymenobacter lapidiphilus]
MLRYKSSIIPTISLFFKSQNDVDIFIEDSNNEEFYKTLFHRLLNNKRIRKIISCKCKTELIKACENDQIDRKRKRIYVTDGDLDLIFDNNRKDLKHLHVLKRYCIENYLLDEEGIIETLYDNIILKKEDIKTQLLFENWLKSITNPLLELFFHYSITHEHKMGIKTVSTTVGSLCKQYRGITVLDNQKIEDKIREIREEIINTIGDDAYNESIYAKRQKWPPNIMSLITIVSAKDYILPLLTFRFKKIKGKETYNLKWESLRIRLAKTCNLNSLDDLKALILSV